MNCVFYWIFFIQLGDGNPSDWEGLEIIIYNRKLNQTEVENPEIYLNTLYNITTVIDNNPSLYENCYTEQPTMAPTTIPTNNPTNIPSTTPSSLPTQNPTYMPSNVPSTTPSMQPSTQPTMQKYPFFAVKSYKFLFVFLR